MCYTVTDGWGSYRSLYMKRKSIIEDTISSSKPSSFLQVISSSDASLSSYSVLSLEESNLPTQSSSNILVSISESFS